MFETFSDKPEHAVLAELSMGAPDSNTLKTGQPLMTQLLNRFRLKHLGRGRRGVRVVVAEGVTVACASWVSSWPARASRKNDKAKPGTCPLLSMFVQVRFVAVVRE